MKFLLFLATTLNFSFALSQTMNKVSLKEIKVEATCKLVRYYHEDEDHKHEDIITQHELTLAANKLRSKSSPVAKGPVHHMKRMIYVVLERSIDNLEEVNFISTKKEYFNSPQITAYDSLKIPVKESSIGNLVTKMSSNLYREIADIECTINKIL